jgi:hypothetical protein
MFSPLATDITDPIERLQAIHDANKGAKAEQKALGASMLMEWAELAAPLTFSLAARFYSASSLADRHPPAFNLIISNVPGPPIPLYMGGAQLKSLYPLGPILEGLGLNVTVLSNMDHMCFGFIAARELMPDLWDLCDSVPDALAELLKATGEVTNGASSAKATAAKKTAPRKPAPSTKPTD